jgi:hypothetical protein
MPNTPTYILYHGRNTGKDKAGKKIWTRIGALWPNKSVKRSWVPIAQEVISLMLPYDKRQQDVHFVPDEYPA